MAATPSIMRELGVKAPSFSLPDTSGTTVSLADYTGQPLLVVFICNHCPFVRHIGRELGRKSTEFAGRGVGVVLISSNDVESYPEDAPDRMVHFRDEFGITVPYLYDESQQVAKAYQATCTPDFFLFDSDHRLVYRGQFDDARPGNDSPVTGADLQDAVDALLDGRPMPKEQKPSMGCGIKWKEGNEPAFTPIA